MFSRRAREKWHQEKLWQGLAKDTLQVVSTDHCPFCFKEQKELGRDDFTKIPNGGPGVEHRLSLIYSGGVHDKRFSVNRFVQLVSTAPAKLFGLYPRKGTIAVGSDADLVIFDTNQKQVISAKTHHMRVDYSMFEGIEVTGVAKTVLSRGRVVIEGGKFLGRAGTGEFIRRQTFLGPMKKYSAGLLFGTALLSSAFAAAQSQHALSSAMIENEFVRVSQTTFSSDSVRSELCRMICRC